MQIKELVKEAHRIAVEHGWYDPPRSPLEVYALIHSEVSEATEWYRVDSDPHQAEEMADIVIRVADYCGYKGWDLESLVEQKMQFNETRAYKHGGKVI